MQYRPPTASTSTGSDWPAVVVAIGILVLLGAVLVTATARWSAGDLRELIGTLAPVLGVVTGAFVTYFFTRQAAATATTVAQTATDAAVKTSESAQAQLESQANRLEAQTQRARVLHNALTAAFGMVDEETAQRMRKDRTIGGALDQNSSQSSTSPG